MDNNLRGTIASRPSPARDVSGPFPGEINYARSSVESTATPQGQGDGDLWNQVVKGAQKSQEKYGIPASLTLAQFFQETGGGNHYVGNNLFGIKGTGPDGAVKALTWEQGPDGPYNTYANFKSYKNVADSIEDHARLLAENPAYKKVQGLIASGDNNPDHYAEALQGVYATDPNYASALKSLMRTHDLVQYDFDNVTKTAKPAGPSPLSPQAGTQQQATPQQALGQAMAKQPQPGAANPQTPQPIEQTPQPQQQAPQYSQNTWLNQKIAETLQGQQPPQQPTQPEQPPEPIRPVQPTGQMPTIPQDQQTGYNNSIAYKQYEIPQPMIGGQTNSTMAGNTPAIPMPKIGGNNGY